MGKIQIKRKKNERTFGEDLAILTAVLFFFLLFVSMWIPKLQYMSERSRLSEEVICSERFRRQPVSAEIFDKLKQSEDPGEFLSVYWMESDFENENRSWKMEKSKDRWEKADGWNEYVGACRAIWNDLKYFPVAEYESGKLHVTFADSWMLDRSYRGDRKHEGSDIMPSVNERDLFPIVSMTDGIVTNVGWLELGGYRIGITAPGGAYFYYAHLSSYTDIQEGDRVQAGDVIGYMGDTGYSKREGTIGKFPVHLHLGIYIYKDGKEISVNPYAPLKYVEDRKMKARYVR